MMPKASKSEPKGKPNASKFKVLYVKKPKKGARKDPSVDLEYFFEGFLWWPKFDEFLKGVKLAQKLKKLRLGRAGGV